ncbi:MAG TPA: hypothetical protein VFB50_14235 [Chloroflexota bacterium]|nr:hypothetical protein [Chloroflexota bacterium]
MRGFVLAILLCVVLVISTAYAQEEDTSGQPPPEITGPSLSVRNQPAPACDPALTRLRYLEVRGAGFDAWALQRLTGQLVDVNGTPLMSWGSVWVSPQGSLTVEVNLCADPFRGSDALAPGTYALVLSQRDGAPIASTSVEIAAPATLPGENAASGDQAATSSDEVAAPAEDTSTQP